MYDVIVVGARRAGSPAAMLHFVQFLSPSQLLVKNHPPLQLS